MRRPAYVLAIVLALGFVFSTAMAQLPATITLGTDPQPPNCVINPAGDTTIFWSVQHQTIPDYVVYKLYFPGHVNLVETQTYPGTTGISVTRHWIVPNGSPSGAYWVRIEYYAIGIGLEAVAEVVFLVCQPSPPGVCCVGETCYILTELECTQSGGIFFPDLASCDNDPCAVPAVCCVGQTCYILTEQECADQGGIFYPDLTSCDNNPCFVPPPPAACCVGDVCIVLTEQECADQGGIFHPEWPECPTPDPCVPTPTNDMNWGTIKSLYK
jgi:hypothetical protein